MDLILSYCHHSLNDKSLRDLLPLLREKGIGIVNGSVLSMGLLTNKVQCAVAPASGNDQLTTWLLVTMFLSPMVSAAEQAQRANFTMVIAASGWHSTCLIPIGSSQHCLHVTSPLNPVNTV